MREIMEQIIELEDKLKPYDAALDLLASLRLHGSEAYAAVQQAGDEIWKELDDLRGDLATKLIMRNA
jgi:hypothetical protein